jgi:head-tail adaptor
MEFFLTLTRKGLTVVTLADNEKEHSRQSMNDDPFQLMGSLMVMIRAHEESAIKSQRVGDAWKIKKKRAIDTKQAMTSRCPGWLRLVGGPKEGRYEIIDERAKLVRQWFDDTIAGIGRRTITRELNTRGLPRWGIGESMGDRWHDSYVAKVISNPATYGTYATTDGSGTLIEIGGYFPAIVDETTFWKAQAASQGRGHGKGSTGKTHRNVLRGLAKCEFCAANMVILDKGRKSKGLKLRCGKAHQSAGCDHRTMYDYGVVEIGVIHGLGDKIAQLSAASVATAKAAAEEVKSVEANRADREKQLGRLLDLVAAGGDVPQVALRVKLLGDEIAILRTQEEDIRRKFGMASVADPVSDVVDLGTIYAELRRLTAEERIKARAEISEKLVHLVDRVVVGPNGFVTHLKDGGFSTMVRVGVNTRHGN